MSRRSLALLRLSVSAAVLSSAAAAHAEPVAFDLAVQPLARSLETVARAGGLTVAVDSALVAGKAAPALKGSFEPADALRRLLAGSGLAVTLDGNKALITAQTGDVALDKVSVQAGALTADQKLQKEGSTDDGYRAQTAATVGPFGSLPLQDTPYSVQVQSRDLIENLQSASPDQLLKTDPFVQLYMPTTLNARPTFNLRGYYNTAVAEDGFRNYNGWVNSLEDVERVETLTGLSGFLYGQGNVGGLINYVSKRPTDTPLADITVGNSPQGSGYVHGDFGGPIGDGRFGYRLNVVEQNGETAISNQTIQRDLVSGAFDAHLSDRALVQFNFSHQDNDTKGLPASWGVARGVVNPAAPDASKLWSQPWTFDNVNSNKAQIGLTYDITDVFTFRAGYVWAGYDQHQLSIGATLQSNGSYTESLQERPDRTLDTNRVYSFLDARFDTFGARHTLTAGFYGDNAEWDYHKDSQYSATLAGTFPLSDPLYVAKPNYTVGVLANYVGSQATNENFVVGDDIALGDHWRLLAGANDARIMAKNFSTNGVPTSRYDDSKVTPSASLVYKPIPPVSTYVTYMQALEQGSQAATLYNNLPVTNANMLMAPVTDDEYEIGAKATLGNTLLTLALFDINRASDVYSPNSNGTYTFTEDGNEEHKGVELGATGRLFQRLTVVGGVTVMDAKITDNPSSPQLVGKIPANSSEQMAKLYAEYDLPYVRGLTLTGGVYYFGPFYADSANTDRRPGVVTADLGARYSVTAYGTPLILRLNVNNITDESYWMSSSFVGDPRTVIFSVQAKF